MKWRISYRIQEGGAKFEIVRKHLLKTVAYSYEHAIAAESQNPDPGIRILKFLVDQERGLVSSDGVFLPHDELAKLPNSAADALSLPPLVPYALELQPHGTIASTDFTILP